VFELARNLGTSVRMIERHYGALLDGPGPVSPVVSRLSMPSVTGLGTMLGTAVEQRDRSRFAWKRYLLADPRRAAGKNLAPRRLTRRIGDPSRAP
jgi:hypothetical protein